MRYPLARNLIIMKGALAWLGLWFALAVLGIWLLNPRILAILFAAALLAVACVKLLKVTWWRTMVSGLVKSAGPLAAVFAVVPAPSLTGLGGMLGWLMLWEVGGQNIHADWNDIEEDRAIGARTIAPLFGLRAAEWLVAALLALTVAAQPAAGALAAGAGLAVPARRAAGRRGLAAPALLLALTRDGRAAVRPRQFVSVGVVADRDGVRVVALNAPVAPAPSA
jgi:4-hydroxybenzoate polyprenyltransferase